MSIPNSRPLARPAKDEWGVYDPQQAGVAALLRRLDSKDPIAPVAAPAAPAAKKEIANAAPARPSLRDAQ
jgi:hypothetical protein